VVGDELESAEDDAGREEFEAEDKESENEPVRPINSCSYGRRAVFPILIHISPDAVILIQYQVPT